jgi:hypothetical protein
VAKHSPFVAQPRHLHLMLWVEFLRVSDFFLPRAAEKAEAPKAEALALVRI